MRAVLQRVSRADLRIEEQVQASIGEGFVILLGVRSGDGPEHARDLAERCARLRVFQDEEGKMNRSLLDTGGEALVVSQFTLYADTRKGNRPGFNEAARPEQAEPLYEQFVETLRASIGNGKVATGVFGAMMDIALVNSGPVTIVLEDRITAKGDQP